MGGDWLSLYKEKLGLTEAVDLSRNFKVQLGIYTEPFHRNWLSDQTKLKIYEILDPVVRDINGAPCRAKIDGEVTGTTWMIELKHTGGNYSVLEEAQRYMAQIQFYMLVGRYQKCIFSVIRGTEEPVHVEVDANDEYQEMLMQSVAQFWQHVAQRNPPDDDWIAASGFHERVEEVTKIVPIDGMISVDMSQSNSWVANAALYLTNEQAAKDFEAAKRDLKNLIPDNAYEAAGAGITLKRSKNGSLRFSKEKNDE